MLFHPTIFQLVEVQELPISSEKPRENSETITELVKFLEQVGCNLNAFEFDFNILAFLGAFGEVRMCVHRESQAQRAVKVLRKSHMDEEEKRMLFNEINILKEIVSLEFLKRSDDINRGVVFFLLPILKINYIILLANQRYLDPK